MEITGWGARLKTARIGAGMTMEDVSNATGFLKASISNYEREVDLPPLPRLAKLCSVYGVSVGQVMGEEPMPQDGEPSQLARQIMSLPPKLQEAVVHLVRGIA